MASAESAPSAFSLPAMSAGRRLVPEGPLDEIFYNMKKVEEVGPALLGKAGVPE